LVTELSQGLATMVPKFPHIKVTLFGTDGNHFAIMGVVIKEMKRSGVSASVINDFRAEATAGDYDHLLQTCMRYVDVI